MDPVALLVVALVCAAVGYVAGFLIGGLGRGKSGPGANKTTGAAKTEGEVELDSEEVELARLYRAKPAGPLLVFANGRRWDKSSQLGETQRASLENLLIEFQHWLVPGLTSPLEQEPRPPAAEEPAAPVVTPPFYPSPQMAVLAAQAAYKQPSTEPKTIVGQIDEVLQEMLPGSPFTDHKIRLFEMPNQGVVVQVDREQYEGIDAVPDPEIRNFIHQAVSTWESRVN